MPAPVRGGPFISIHAKILGFILLCVVVPVVALGAYLLREHEAILATRVRETLAGHLLRTASQVDDWMSQRLRMGARWSSGFVVSQGLDALGAGAEEAAVAERALKSHLALLIEHDRACESLMIAQSSGAIVAGTREEQLEGWARAKIASGEVPNGGIVSPLLRSEYLGRPTLLVLHPILASNDQPRAYLVARIDVRELELVLAVSARQLAALSASDFDEARRRETPALAPSLWLLDGEGHVLTRAGTVVDRPGEEPFPAALPQASLAEGLVTEDLFPGLGRTAYGVRRLQGPWPGYVAATVPLAVAYRSLEASRSRLLKYGIPLLAAICLLNFAAMRRMLRPIHLLSQGARKVSEGDLDVYLPVRGKDEIADLTRAFNEMAGKIREGRLSLEEARDELARSNEGLQAANRTLETLAITDGLTGLYNRRHFQETLEKELRRCDREGRTLSLLLCDVDHFKQYNDRFGHTEGDAALRRVSGQIMRSIRSTDLAFRYGGEELAVLLPSCTKEQACDVAEKIRRAVSKAAPRAGRPGAPCTVSIGVATFPEDGRVARALVDMADAALYAAKHRGRDQVVAARIDEPPTRESAG
jgi:diguanylate cyclase (GGDEF)-like protein